MKILMSFRPDISGGQVEEYSPIAMAINLGNCLHDRGHSMGYMTAVDSWRFRNCNGAIFPEPQLSVKYELDSSMSQKDAVQESFMVYRDCEYDVLNFHSPAFQIFGYILKCIRPEDRVVLSFKAPANIGRSFYLNHQNLVELLKFPNFRMALPSYSGSYDPLKSFFKGELPEGFDRVRVVQNGIVDLGIKPIPPERKADRFMIIGHMTPSKNILQSLRIAVDNNIKCVCVSKRIPNKPLTPEEQAYVVQCEELIHNHPQLIEYYDRLTYVECIRQLALSKALISFSTIEAFGFVPVEAAQVGTPVVWLECQGIDETMIEGTTGLKITKSENKGWQQKRARALDFYKEVQVLDQEIMSNSVKSRFSMVSCAQRYENLFSDLVTHASS